MTKAASKLVSDAGGCVGDTNVVGAVGGNSGETAWGTGTVNSDKVTTEPTVVTIEGKASQTDQDIAECFWTSLLVCFVSVSDCSSFE